jgi:putative transposase
MYTKCLKFRLIPTPAQETALCQTLDTCRNVYNSLLNERKHDYEVWGKSPSRYQQQKHFPHWAKVYPEIKTVFSQVLQNVAVRVDSAFKAFFTRVQKGATPGFPRFKGEGYDSFTYPQKGFKVGQQCVYLSKIGTVKAVLHRPMEGRVKTCTIRRQNDKWYICFAVEVEAEPLLPSEEQVGVDVGLNQFAALSNGECVENPRFFRKDEKALAKAQRKLAKQKKGSRKRRKAKKVVSRIHERIRNRRHDFVHQTARRLVNRFGLIAVEKLNVTNMSKRPAPKQDATTGQYLPNGASQKTGLNKSITDAAWSLFRNVLTSKAESAGRQVVNVNPAYTSQDCSGCGTRIKKQLSERVHFCPSCGLSLDRDTNAARNLLQTAVGQHSVAGISA